MTRQLPKPVAVPLGWILCGAINAGIYGGGWLCMRWDDTHDAWQSRRAARQMWREANEYLRDEAR